MKKWLSEEGNRQWRETRKKREWRESRRNVNRQQYQAA